MKIASTVLFLLTAALPLNATERLALRVSPMVSFAPAFVRIEAMIERDDNNRLLTVIAESTDFYRSSEISLNGANSPRVNVFNFRELPTGTYQVTGILLDRLGHRSAATKVVRVAPSAGAR